jgi:Dynamin family
MIVCARCGHHNPSGLSFCANCDAFLDWNASGQAETAAAPPHPAPVSTDAPGAAPNTSPMSASPTPSPEPSIDRDELGPSQRVEIELVSARRAAAARDRQDLVERLDEARRALAERDLAVVVVGEYKQGKSSLINAILSSEVCPVDDDVVTAVPTIVAFGDPPGAVVHRETDGAGEIEDTPIPFEAVRDFVRDAVDDIERSSIRSVEIRLDRRVLRSGLSFVDTPGVGGLESAEGNLTLSVLGLAHAVLFVTDASQELTLPELSFMKLALERCPTMLCVVTKVDLYPEWRRIVEINRGHLERAGVEVEVVAVSSFLRMRATTVNDPAMNVESGFPPLMDFLRDEVVQPGAAAKAANAAAEVEFSTVQLRQGLEAEAEVVAEPEGGEQVVERLSRATEVAGALGASNAPWQQVLADGIQDLASDVDHDLRARLRTVTRTAEEVIDRSDPKDSWAEFESWLRRHVAESAVATYDHLLESAGHLTELVGRQFSEDADTPLAFSIDAPLAALEDIQLGGAFGKEKGARSNIALSAARGSYGGILMFGMVGGLIGIPFITPIAVVLSLGLARKAVRDDLKRRHAMRQQQAKAALRQYIDEVSFVVNKECRDALRRTQRLLRDEFGARARSLQRSSVDALAHAERAMQLPPEDREARRRQLEGELRQLDDVGKRAAAAVGVGSS